MFFIFIFQLYILNCVLSASQKSRDDSLFLNKCSTEKLCLLADVMLTSMIMLRIMVSNHLNNNETKQINKKIYLYTCIVHVLSMFIYVLVIIVWKLFCYQTAKFPPPPKKTLFFKYIFAEFKLCDLRYFENLAEETIFVSVLSQYLDFQCYLLRSFLCSMRFNLFILLTLVKLLTLNAYTFFL